MAQGANKSLSKVYTEEKKNFFLNNRMIETRKAKKNKKIRKKNK